AGYETYICSGYASKKICIDSRVDSELSEYDLKGLNPSMDYLDDANKTLKNITDKYQNYDKNLIDRFQESLIIRNKFTSKYDTEMENRKKQKDKDIESNYNGSSMNDDSFDPLEGLRVHCWLLVKEPNRGVSESFFLDAPSGRSFDLNSSEFHGVECCWNNRNIWVNMQSCKQGISSMSFEFDDLKSWEPFFGNKNINRNREIPIKMISYDPYRYPIAVERWQQLKQKANKTFYYKKLKYETFLKPFESKEDGLKFRMTKYFDNEYKHSSERIEIYSVRMDGLLKRHFEFKEKLKNNENHILTQYFACGVQKSCLAKIQLAVTETGSIINGAEKRCTFYHRFRDDSLLFRRDSDYEIEEFFGPLRSDSLVHRKVIYDPTVTKAVSHNSPNALARPIYSIEEIYRKFDKKSCLSVEKRPKYHKIKYEWKKNKIYVDFFPDINEENCQDFQYRFREYEKSQLNEDIEVYVAENKICDGFEGSLNDEPSKDEQLCELRELLESESKSIASIRESEIECSLNQLITYGPSKKTCVF
ncbi:MAG: hypothetical protein MHPSP_001027, partial [Paramarteilia canceri]